MLISSSITRAAVGMGIPMGIPVGMGWVWGLICHPHGSSVNHSWKQWRRGMQGAYFLPKFRKFFLFENFLPKVQNWG